MKWQVILPVVAMMCMAFVPQAAEAHHHHCGYGGYNNGYGGYGGGYNNAYQMQRMMGFQNRGYGGYGNGYGGGYGNGYGGYGNSYGGGYGNSGAMMSGFGRLLRGF